MRSRALLLLRRGFLYPHPHPVRHASHTSGKRKVSEPRWKRYDVTAEGTGTRCVTADGSFAMTTDVPASMGGTDSGPQPVNHLLSALCGCKTATAAFVAMKMKPRISVERLQFSLTAERDERGSLNLPLVNDSDIPSRLQRVVGTCFVDGDMSEDELAFLQRQVHKRCPVANMFESSGCVVDIKWKKSGT